jgi:hypothetical protein
MNNDPVPWNILKMFAEGTVTLPEVESQLMEYLGPRYVCSDWLPALDAVFSAEDDVEKAVKSLENLRLGKHETRSKLTPPRDLVTIEQELVQLLDRPPRAKRLSLEDLLNSVERHGESFPHLL